MNIYLDNAATTSVDPEVALEMARYFCKDYGNPSSSHVFGRIARQAVDESREKIARLLQANPEEIYFTSGATESNNLILKGAVRGAGISHVITTKLEHPSVLNTLRKLEQKAEISLHFVETNDQGNISFDHLFALSSAYPEALVSIIHGNNEIGNINDINAIGRLVKERGCLFHTDTVQTIGQLKFSLSNQQADFVIGSAHKFHGPKGVGFAYLRQGTRLPALLDGGGQERGIRSGTENVCGIVGLARALEIAVQEQLQTTSTIASLKHYLIERLVRSVPLIRFNGNSSSDTLSLPNIISMSFPKLLFGSWLENLQANGIAISGASACSGSGHSHVLSELKVNKDRENIRVSLSKYNTKEEIDVFINLLQEEHYKFSKTFNNAEEPDEVTVR